MPDGDVKLNLRYFIHSALQKKMSWSTLTYFLNDLTPTLEKSREVVEILVKEIEKLAIKLDKLGIEIEKEQTKEKEMFDEVQAESETVHQKTSLIGDYNNYDSMLADQDLESEEEFEGENLFEEFNQEEFSEKDLFDDKDQEKKNELYTFVETDHENEYISSENEKEFNNMETASIDLPNKAKRSKTNICKIYLKKPKDLGIDSAQSKEKPLECKTCGKRFKLPTYLEAHEKIHEDLLQNFSLNCNDDKDKAFEDTFVEVNVNQIDKKLYLIPKNEYKTKDYGEEINHDESENALTKWRFKKGESNTCETCSKTFSSSWSLKNHRKIHTGEKKFKCKFCGKRFSILQYLKNHERIHTGTKPYECKTCHKSFNQLGNFKSHEKLHTGERPFQCLICQKDFIRSDAYKKHVKNHTKVKLPKKIKNGLVS